MPGGFGEGHQVVGEAVGEVGGLYVAGGAGGLFAIDIDHTED